MGDHKNLDYIYIWNILLAEKTSLLDNVQITNHHYVIVY